MRKIEFEERTMAGIVIVALGVVVYAAVSEPMFGIAIAVLVGGVLATYLLGWGYLSACAYVRRKRTPSPGAAGGG